MDAKRIHTLDRLHGVPDGEAMKFVVRDDVFVVFLVKDSPVGCAGHYRIETLQASFRDVLAGVRTKIGRPKLSLAIKAVGPHHKLEILRKIVEHLGLILKSATAIDKQAEIYYYPRSSRVRVSAAAIAALPVPPAAIPITHGPSTVALSAAAPVLLAVATRKITVGIIDDSKTIRILLRNILSAVGDIEVLWEAGLPSEALRRLNEAQPDVLTLDLHMPEMNGVQLLKAYIDKYPIPTVVISSLSKEESPLVFDALEGGAVDYIQKPTANDLSVVGSIIVEKLRTAAVAKIIRSQRPLLRPSRLAKAADNHNYLVAMGASTGGTEALKSVLIRLPEEIPPIIIVQHIPPVFSLAFAKRLNDLCPFEVKEAADGDAVLPGRVLIAPGGLHMELKKYGAIRKVTIVDRDPVNRHKPSVDVLFDSVAQNLGPNAIGIIFTGMGGDGSKGLLRMKEAGARTIAQDEASSVVFGMPKEAIRLGAAEKVAPLEDIPRVLMALLSEAPRSAKLTQAK